jgi:uncharacterized membrane protein YeiH
MLLPLVLIWIGIGLIAGLLAHTARLGFGARGMVGRSALLGTLALGAVTALLGGMIATLLLGRLFGTPTAIWVSILAVIAVPWIWQRARSTRAQ